MSMTDMLYAAHASNPYFLAVETNIKMLTKGNCLNNTYPSKMQYMIHDASVRSIHDSIVSGSIPSIYINLECSLQVFNDTDNVNVSVIQYDDVLKKARKPEDSYPTLTMQYNINEEELKMMIDGGFYTNPVVYKDRLCDNLKHSLFEKEGMLNVRDYKTDGSRMNNRFRIVKEIVALEVAQEKDFDNSLNILMRESFKDLIEMREAEKNLADVSNFATISNNKENTITLDNEIVFDESAFKPIELGEEITPFGYVPEDEPLNELDADEVPTVHLNNELDLGNASYATSTQNIAVADIDKPKIDTRSPESIASDDYINKLSYETSHEEEKEDDGLSL